MDANQKLIVVPWDFTPVAEHALAHAVKISHMVKNGIGLLHIIDSGKSNKSAGERKILLQHASNESSRKYNMPISAFIVKGTIFTSIAEFVNKNDASLVVMGTHGMKGMQKLTGSWALKVIVKSKVPFIVVQDPPSDQERYHNIVFPVDFKTESKEKTQMAIFMGKYFDSKINILVATTTDKNILRKTNVNKAFAIKYFIQNNIEYEIHEIPKGNFAQQTIDFGVKTKADAILIVTTKNITFADYVIGASEQ